MTIRNENIHYCDFCGKSQFEVEQIITGGKADICNKCVELSMLIILEKRLGINAEGGQDEGEKV